MTNKPTRNGEETIETSEPLNEEIKKLQREMQFLESSFQKNPVTKTQQQIRNRIEDIKKKSNHIYSDIERLKTEKSIIKDKNVSVIRAVGVFVFEQKG